MANGFIPTQDIDGFNVTGVPAGFNQTSIPPGPIFVDTGGCRCSLKQTNVTGTEPVAWRCAGNVKTSLDIGTSGKWFPPTTDNLAGQNILSLPPDWPGDAPNTTDPQVLEDSGFAPVTDDRDSRLSLQDNACTGVNSTGQSKQLYGVINGKGPGVCRISPLAVPLPIQNATEWDSTGCLDGFLCVNNSINRPPEYCPPDPKCLVTRLAKQFCDWPQGDFEPLLCPAGRFCPPGGKEIFFCPEGSYCPIGSTDPIPCSFGASCPQGSVRNLTFLPLVVLLILDFALVTWHLGIKCAKKRANGRTLKQNSAKNLRSMVRSAAGLMDGQHARQMERTRPDPEISFEANIKSVRRQNTGFLSTFADPEQYDEPEDLSEKGDVNMRLFVDYIAKCLGGTSFGLSFEFENLHFQTKRERKVILSEVTGQICSGSLWGVMGASGAGKSTFVNVLMGKTAHTGGSTKVNGQPGKISDYRRVIGYVPQDDILLPELTVKENILHSARIRLPSSWSDREIDEFVEVLIRCLQLEHVKDSLVGSPAAPVISGGQRKRVSIGMELAAIPMALFLDEPTSGLDSSAANSVMGILKALSKVGMTVVTIIHQPRQEIFESLDNLLLLGQGRMLYQGRTDQSREYFEALGFRFPRYANPADVISDIMAGQGSTYKKSGETRVDALINYWAEQGAKQRPLHPITPSLEEHMTLRRSIRARGAYFHRQVWFCLLRAVKQQLRYHDSIYYELSVGALAGFLIGLAEFNEEGQNFVGLFHIPYTYMSSAMDYVSILQFALLTCLAIGLTASSPGVKVFGEEKLVYYREAASGHNRFAYYLGKVISTLPRMILANLHFTILSQMLATPMISFGIALLTNFLYFYCVYGLASIVSMLVRREDGPLLATILSLIVGVLSGVSPTLRTVHNWHLGWLWRASPGTWLAELYFNDNVAPLEYLYQIDFAAQATGYYMGQRGLDLLMLFVIGSVYRVVAYLGLRFCHRQNQR